LHHTPDVEHRLLCDHIWYKQISASVFSMLSAVPWLLWIHVVYTTSVTQHSLI